MSRLKLVYRCTDCTATTPKWAGRCASCGAWNSLVEEVTEARSGTDVALSVVTGSLSEPVPIAAVDVSASVARSTGVAELDQVLGGGLVPGSVTLVGGEPGVGKSTLLLQVAAVMARGGAKVLYASGEESPQQVRVRAERLGALADDLYLVAEVLLPNLVAHLDRLVPDVVIVDSIQTVQDPELSSAPGTVSQVRDGAQRLVQEAKARSCAVVLVGHVTKDGALAGPRVLEHVVDTVLSVEGDRHHGLRLVRAVKHRFGATNELGLFEMGEEGLRAVDDASGLFLADRRSGVSGSVVVPAMEGQRPLLVEVQSLVVPPTSPMPTPRRSAQGVDSGRLNMLLAVLDRRVGLRASDADIYALAVGGVRLVEPAADLGLALAVVSSLLERPLPDDLVAIGEVGLGGELRRVSQLPRRLQEAARMGFKRAVVPASTPIDDGGLQLLRAASLQDAIEAAGLFEMLERLPGSGDRAR